MADSVVRITGGNASNVAQIIITDLSSSYFKYEIIFSNLRSHTQDSNLLVDLSADNGSSWDSSYSFRMQVANLANSTVTETGTTYGDLRCVDSILNSSDYTYGGTIDIFYPMDSASKTTLITRSVGAGSDNSNVIEMCSSQQVNTQADNALKIRSHNGTTSNNFSMQYVVYGYIL